MIRKLGTLVGRGAQLIEHSLLGGVQRLASVGGGGVVHPASMAAAGDAGWSTGGSGVHCHRPSR